MKTDDILEYGKYRAREIYCGLAAIFLGSVSINLSTLVANEDGVKTGIAIRRQGLGKLMQDQARYFNGRKMFYKTLGVNKYD